MTPDAHFQPARRVSSPSDAQDVAHEAETVSPAPERPAGRSRQANQIPWPDALSDAALYGPAGDFVRTVEPQSEADPAALLIQFLVAFGSVVGRKPHFMAEDSAHYTTEFAILVGETSKARKGTSFGPVRRLFRFVDSAWHDGCVHSGLSSGEGLIDLVRDATTKEEKPNAGDGLLVLKQTVIEAGMDDKRALIVEGEFARVCKVMRREGNILSTIVRDAWDGLDLRTLTKHSPMKATGAHISLIGHITREELLRHLDATEQANGFGNRFLWFCVRRSKQLPEGGRVPDEDMLMIAAQVADAVTFARGVSELRRDEDARVLWYEVYGPLSDGKPGMLGAMTARAEAHVMRLACLYALLDMTDRISRGHLEAALAVWKYANDSARYIFGQATGDPIADQIMRALRATTAGLDRTRISGLFGRHESSERIETALALLERAGAARCVRDTDTGGRPREVWHAC